MFQKHYSHTLGGHRAYDRVATLQHIMRRRRVKNRIKVWFSKQSSRRAIKKGIKSMLICAIIAGVFWAVVNLPIISVRKVTIAQKSTIHKTLQSEILTYAKSVLDEKVYGIKGKTRYFFRKNEFEKMLRDKFLQAGTISIESSMVNKWSIVVTRRNSFGTYCTKTSCLLIDVGGTAFMETGIHIGTTIQISDNLSVGEQVFENEDRAKEDFSKVPEIVTFLEERGIPVLQVSLRRDTRVVHIALENGIDIWIDSSETLYDTTRALHVVFQEVFGDAEKQSKIASVDVRNPLSIIYENK